MMASQKIPSTALQRFFRHSRYFKYDFESEKPLRLVYELFSLAIKATFCGTKNNKKSKLKI